MSASSQYPPSAGPVGSWQPGKIDFYMSCRNSVALTSMEPHELVFLIRGAACPSSVCGIPDARRLVQLVPDYIRRHREGEDLKKHLPAVSISASIAGPRKNAAAEGRVTHSGFMQVDIDKLGADGGPTVDEVRHLLIDSGRCCLVFTSPSGNGVKALVKVTGGVEGHLGAFHALGEFIAAMGLELDPQTKDVVRLMYLTHDPEAWSAPDWAAVEAFDPLPPPPPPPPLPLKARETQDSVAADVAEADAMLKAIAGQGRPDYGDWLKIIAGTVDKVGSVKAEELLKEWLPEEQPGEYKTKIENGLDRITAATLAWYAIKAGWKPEGGKYTPGFLRELCADRIYHLDRGNYLMETNEGFTLFPTAAIRRHLMSRVRLKLEGKAAEKTAAKNSIVSSALNWIDMQNSVSYAGPLAGYWKGPHEQNSRRILVTSDPVFIGSAPGEWPVIRETLRCILGGDELGDKQITWFNLWLKLAREAIRESCHRPGQLLALCGPVQCGKSLLLDFLTKALGGRRESPHKLFSGKTGFNAELAGSELLAIDDALGSSDIRSRREFAAALKENVFAGAVRIEAKHCDAVTLSPCWRVAVALNDNPESMIVLPPLDEDVKDKIALLRCFPGGLPMPTSSVSERREFFATLEREIPAYSAALEAMEIPPETAESRCGIRAFQHPDLLSALESLSPEHEVLEMILIAVSKGFLHLPWQGTARFLREELMRCSGEEDRVRSLLNTWGPALGIYLGRLASRGDGFVKRGQQDEGIGTWKLGWLDDPVEETT